MQVEIEGKTFTVYAKVGRYSDELKSIAFYDEEDKRCNDMDESDLTEEQLEEVIEEAIDFRDDYLAERQMDAMEDYYD